MMIKHKEFLISSESLVIENRQGTHRKPTGSSDGTQRKLIGNSRGSHRKLKGNAQETHWDLRERNGNSQETQKGFKGTQRCRRGNNHTLGNEFKVHCILQYRWVPMSFEMHQFLLFIWEFPTPNSPQSTVIIGSPPAATPLYLYLPFCARFLPGLVITSRYTAFCNVSGSVSCEFRDVPVLGGSVL